MAETERGYFRFWAKPGLTAETFVIASEPAGDVSEGLKGRLEVQLANGTTLTEATHLADLMNSQNHIVHADEIGAGPKPRAVLERMSAIVNPFMYARYCAC